MFLFHGQVLQLLGEFKGHENWVIAGQHDVGVAGQSSEGGQLRLGLSELVQASLSTRFAATTWRVWLFYPLAFV